MERHIDILEKYYEEIHENCKLDIGPSAFAARCVREYDEKKKREKDNKGKRKKDLALEFDGKKKNIEWRNSSGKKRSRSEEDELRSLGYTSSRKYLLSKGESKTKSLKDLAKLIDIIRGD